MTNNNFLTVNGLSVAYDGQLALQDVSFSLVGGEVSCLLGPSGCGKSSLLRAIAGFEPVTQGRVCVNGRDLDKLSVQERAIGFVFQDSALFPNLSVLQNVCFGLRNATESRKREASMEWLERVGLVDRANTMPHELSGGEQQRVALARALVAEPELVLLDEPFASLDLRLRRELASELKTIFKQGGVTALFVTHDQEEAFLLADKLGVMSEGVLHQWADAHTIYHQPVNATVAEFIGEGFFLEGKPDESGVVASALGGFRCKQAQGSSECLITGDRVSIFLRPNEIAFADAGEYEVSIAGVQDYGDSYLYVLRLSDGSEALIRSNAQFDLGSMARVSPVTKDVSVFLQQ